MSQQPGQKVILVIDDNQENSRLVEKILTKAGYHCILCNDSAEGMRIMRERRPDLLLLDMSLPGMDGWEFATAAKADESIRQIPIVALTAHAMKDDRARAIAAGCDAYMSKPFRSAELLVMIREMAGA